MAPRTVDDESRLVAKQSFRAGRNVNKPKSATLGCPPGLGYTWPVSRDTGRNLSASLEDYLEAISQLQQEHRLARVKDIAALLQVTMPSVTHALKNLRDKDLVNYERNSYISLTDMGTVVADRVSSRHRILVEFLSGTLLLPPERSETIACELEHAVDTDTVDRLRRLVDEIDRSYDSEAWARVMSDSPPDPDRDR